MLELSPSEEHKIGKDMKFQELGLTKQLTEIIEKKGYIAPTPIQQQAIPMVLRGCDLFACAQTGTGKTASFLLPILEILKNSTKKAFLPRAIILEPTRELAAQVYEKFVEYCPDGGLKAVLLVGGEFMGAQERALKEDVDIIIATPGRLLDMLERGKIMLHSIKSLVIDEADRMLDMGFIPDIEQLVKQLPVIRQTLLFSATMPKEVESLAENYLINPRKIKVTRQNKTAETVAQSIVKVSDKDKRIVMRSAINKYGQDSTMIFCNRKRDIRVLLSSLARHDYAAVGLHGDMPQYLRNEALEQFKTGEVKIMVASDVAARGIDISGMGLVINFDVPSNAEDYVHRIGRTGRAGCSGRAIMIVGEGCKIDAKNLSDIEKLTKQSIKDESDVYAREVAESRRPPAPVVGFGEFRPKFFDLFAAA